MVGQTVEAAEVWCHRCRGEPVRLVLFSHGQWMTRCPRCDVVVSLAVVMAHVEERVGLAGTSICLSTTPPPASISERPDDAVH